MSLEFPVKISQIVGLVCLPFDNNNFVGSKLLASGWGRTSPSIPERHRKLQAVQLTVNRFIDCAMAVPKKVRLRDELHICAGLNEGKGILQGDSGGKLRYLAPF